MSFSVKNVAGHWLVFAVIVVDLIGFGIIIPVLPFISPALGGDEMDVALVIAVFSLCAGVVGPFWGALSDRIGRKTVLMVCLFGGALSYLMLGLADELWMVYAARAFGGLMAGSLPVATALMADLSPPERRAKAMGLVGTAFGIGLVLGPLLGGLLAGDSESLTQPSVFAAAISAISVLLAAVLLPSDRPSKPSKAASTSQSPSALWRFLRTSRSELLMLQYVLHTLAVSAGIYLSPLWLAATEGWGPREVGLLFGLVGMAMVVIQGTMLDWLTHRFGLIVVLSVGASLFALSLVSASVVEAPLARASVIFFAFVGATCCLPILNTIASSVVASDDRGKIMGLTAFSASFGRVLGPLLTGFCLSSAGYQITWLAMALPVAGVIVWSRTSGQRYGNVDQPDVRATKLGA